MLSAFFEPPPDSGVMASPSAPGASTSREIRAAARAAMISRRIREEGKARRIISAPTGSLHFVTAAASSRFGRLRADDARPQAARLGRLRADDARPQAARLGRLRADDAFPPRSPEAPARAPAGAPPLAPRSRVA